jgi:hypothetical protein
MKKIFLLSIVFLLGVKPFQSKADTRCRAGNCIQDCKSGCGCISATNDPNECFCFCAGASTPEPSTMFGDNDEVDISISTQLQPKDLESFFNAVFTTPVIVPEDFKPNSLSTYSKKGIKMVTIKKDFGLLTIEEFKEKAAKKAWLNFLYGCIVATTLLLLIYLFIIRKKTT